MKRILVVAVILVASSSRFEASAGEGGFSQRLPVDHGIPPPVAEEPYYECAAYGYQLSRGACAPGWPPPGADRGLTGRAYPPPGRYGYGAAWARDPAPHDLYGADGYGGEPRGAPQGGSPWRPEPSYQWVPDHMHWYGRSGSLAPGERWDDGGGWGEGPDPAFGDGSPAPPPVPAGQGDAGTPATGDPGGVAGSARRPAAPPAAVPWDPWLHEGAVSDGGEMSPALGKGGEMERGPTAAPAAENTGGAGRAP